MATSIESSSPSPLHKGPSTLMGTSPTFSPSSEKHFWSTLNNRVDKILENKKSSLQNQVGTRDLARSPKLTEILHCTLEKCKEELKADGGKDGSAEEDGERKRGQKRKLISDESSENQEQVDDSLKENGKVGFKELGFNKAKNLAISMATKSATLARELKSIKSDLGFIQERCTLLEEENRRLRDGLGNGILPEDDDLMRLQMEALLAEKSRLGNENANLTRENQCLRQLVEYHQLTSQDLSASYENLIRGMGLEFSSPEDILAQEEDDTMSTQHADLCNLSKNLDELY
ncbi:hypothetical protein Leryth_026267 [Lithospermum erythrorhizon]|nr:hypothetical protein Leryth_026267 [Lithospermum erythrorhizon]